MIQHSSHKPDGDSRDLLLFDYLEGNLTEERARALEEALANDADLRDELENWKESFVVQDFYPTDALEAQLLQHYRKPYSFFGPAAGFILVLVTSLFSFIPVGEQPERVPFPVQESVQPAVMPSENSVRQTTVPVEATKEAAVVVQEKSQEAAAVPLVPASEQHSSAIKALEVTSGQRGLLPAPERLVPESAATFSEASVLASEIARVKPKKSHQPKTITRKQQRQITKMKEKTLQQRKANEFIKGNRPYVVPLDTKNF